MCRLYGMTATHPTRVECELLEAQNSLIKQAVEDGRGLENPHGWGVGMVRDGVTECARQVEPANSSEEFRRNAIQSASETFVAHVRRATVGDPLYENTHPFRYQNSLMAHNGHVGAFDQVRTEILEYLPDSHRERIGGTTDSEHFFQLVHAHRPDADSRIEALQRAASQMREWTRQCGEGTELFLNTIWSDDGAVSGTKLERSLWYLERDEPVACGICNTPHATPDDEPYRSIVLASEKITGENWKRVPEGTTFRVTPDYELEIEPLF